MDVRPVSAPEASRWVHTWPTHLLACVDDANEAVDTPGRPDLRRHVEVFADVTDPDHPAAATPRTVDRVVAFARGVDEDGRLLVHCRGGVGRSTAASIVALVVCGTEPADAFERIAAVRPQMQPNGWLLLLADEQLTPRDSSLWAAWVDWSSRQEHWWPVDRGAYAAADKMPRQARVDLVKAQTHRLRGVDHGPLRRE